MEHRRAEAASSESDPGTASAGGLETRDLVEAVGLITAPAAGLAALGLYFGWKRTQTYATYFGIDNSVLGFSLQEYTLRSATSIYRIILFGVGAGLAALLLHRFVAFRLAPRRKRVAAWVIGAAGTFLLLVWSDAPVGRLLGEPPPMLQAAVAGGLGLIVLISARQRRGTVVAGGLAVAVLLLLLDAAAVPAHDYVIETPYVATQTTLAFGITMLAYAHYVLNTEAANSETANAVRESPTWMRLLSIVFLSLLLAAGLFAATDEYAEAVGTREAQLTADLLDGRRGVIVYSQDDLGLPAVVKCRQIGSATAPFRHRCEGLRLFVRTPTETLVLPSTWSRSDGIDADDRIISIPQDDAIRLEFTPGRDDLLFESR